MLFTCLNLLPATGFEQRIYNILEYVDTTSMQFNNQNAAILKKDKVGYGTIDKAFHMLSQTYTLDRLGENTTGIATQFYSMGRLCDIRSPYFFITVFANGDIKIFNPEFTGNVRSLNDNDIVDMRRNLFNTEQFTYYNNIWTETPLQAKAWDCLDNVILFKGSYEYSFGQNVAYKGINYFVVGREYNQEIENIVNYAVSISSKDMPKKTENLSLGIGAGIIKQEQYGLQGVLEFSNGLRINYIRSLGISGSSGSGFSQAFWTFPKPFNYMFFGGSAIPTAGRVSWHQCMVNIVPQYTNDYRSSCKIVCKGVNENTWVTYYNAFVIGI